MASRRGAHLRKTFAALAFVAASFPAAALAQSAEGESTPPPPPVSTAAPAPPAGSFQCMAGDDAGMDPGDAHTATSIVCSELAKAGAPAGSTFRVGLGKLGKVVIL